MPKMKSHGGISKKITVRASGSTKIGHVGANHNSGKKPTDFNRKARKVNGVYNATSNVKGNVKSNL